MIKLDDSFIINKRGYVTGFFSDPDEDEVNRRWQLSKEFNLELDRLLTEEYGPEISGEETELGKGPGFTFEGGVSFWSRSNEIR